MVGGPLVRPLRGVGAGMKKLTAALVCAAAAAAATAAPSASAGTTCQTANNALTKYGVSERFEQMMVYVGDEVSGPVGTACSVTP